MKPLAKLQFLLGKADAAFGGGFNVKDEGEDDRNLELFPGTPNAKDVVHLSDAPFQEVLKGMKQLEWL